MRVENIQKSDYRDVWMTLSNIDGSQIKSFLKNSQIEMHLSPADQTGTDWHSMLTIDSDISVSRQPVENTEIQKNDKPPTSHEFVQFIWPYAKKAASALGLHPSLLIAQAILETGWGKHTIMGEDGSSSHNVFNIKSLKSNPASVEVTTTEYENDSAVKIRDRFKKYDSIDSCFEDYVVLLKNNPRYQESLQQVADPSKFMHSLQKAGYATDPKYADKVLSIYSQLEGYDK